MSQTLRDRPFYRLTRHFFSGLFELDVLNEAGSDAFGRMIAGICAAFLSFGLILTRVAMVKYANLSPADLGVLMAEEAFLLALPMWVGAVVTVLVGHGLFPDERDFRILMALPVTQRLIFAAKASALALFAGLFVLAVHAALTPILILLLVTRSAGIPPLGDVASFAIATASASAFTILAIIAVNGLLLLTAPSDRLLSASAALRSVILGVLVLAFPFVWRLSGMSRPFADRSAWLYGVPPAWFMGLDQVLRGTTEPFFGRLAAIGGLSLGLAALCAIGSYAVLYRRFDRVMVRATRARPRAEGQETFTLPAGRTSSPAAFHAVRAFTVITLRRSVLHQGIVVSLGAVGLAYVVNSLVSTPGWVSTSQEVARNAVTSAVIWSPFPLIFALCAAVRIGLSVPIEQRANWIFRMTETASTRVDRLRAAVRVIGTIGVAVPIVICLPVQWPLLGWKALVAAGVTCVVGLLFVELLMKEWARIPFTCSYIPGKRFVPQMLLTAFVTFIVLTTGGAGLVRYALTGRPEAAILVTVVAGTVLGLSRRRVRYWRETPLLFEDQLPTEVNPLRLSPD